MAGAYLVGLNTKSPMLYLHNFKTRNNKHNVISIPINLGLSKILQEIIKHSPNKKLLFPQK